MSVPFKKQREPIPKRLGRYEVRAKIADGGMATIYLGRLGLGSPLSGAVPAGERVVALKVIKAEYALNREFVDMFLDEAKIVSKLSHPNVVELYELGNEGDRHFIAMELLSGQSLWSVWEACRERNVRLRYDLVAWIGARIAQGLHHAHELRDGRGKPLNIVHRDVNASNVFITYDGQVKIIDFGLAKAANRVSRTAAGIVKGKLAYMSPEQTVGKPLDCRTDIFALGTTLWELTVDRRLFKGRDDVETLTAVHNAKIPDPTKLVEGYPSSFWTVIRRALERDRDRRYRNANEFSQKLDECARMEGRQPNASAMKEVMLHLFAAERERQMAWIADASGLDSLRPIPISKVEPPPGTFAPATRDDIDSADILEAVCHPDLTEPFELARRKWPRRPSPRLLAGVLALLTAFGFLIAAILWKP